MHVGQHRTLAAFEDDRAFVVRAIELRVDDVRAIVRGEALNFGGNQMITSLRLLLQLDPLLYDADRS